MKLFKNFKTKRQLREENERLKAMMNNPCPMYITEREVKRVYSCMDITDIVDKVPMAEIKKQIAYNLIDCIEPFIEWDIEDSSDEQRYGKIVRGNIYLAKRK